MFLLACLKHIGSWNQINFQFFRDYTLFFLTMDYTGNRRTQPCPLYRIHSQLVQISTVCWEITFTPSSDRSSQSIYPRWEETVGNPQGEHAEKKIHTDRKPSSQLNQRQEVGSGSIFCAKDDARVLVKLNLWIEIETDLFTITPVNIHTIISSISNSGSWSKNLS